MSNTKKWDVICLGRASVDLYAEQIGARLEDVTSFAKYIGGSSLNIATGTYRLGLKSAMITRVGGEQFGTYIMEQLQKEGVDTSQIVIDKDRLTALAILGIKNKEQFPLLFYRDNCADAALCADDINEDAIASSKALLITGTHLSKQPILGASLQALEYAKKHGVKRCLDIDYRPVLWGLTSKGDGDTRYVADDSVTEHLQSILEHFDLVVGTDEEIHIAGGTTDTVQALRNIRELTDAVIVFKRGALGATVYEGDIPDNLDDGINAVGVQVDVLNVLGAGDAFMSGFLRGWIVGDGVEKALQYANASGALVVSRHGCTPAMPTWEELQNYLSRAHDVPRPDLDDTLNYLHRVTAPDRPVWDKDLCIFAFDHRVQLTDMADAYGVPHAKIIQAKRLMLQGAKQGFAQSNYDGHMGIFADETWGQDVLNDATGYGGNDGENIWVSRPMEQPKSYPIEFERGDDVGSQLKNWPKEQVVKLLFFYHPDADSQINKKQLKRVQLLWQGVYQSGHELLLEIIHPDGFSPTDDSIARAMQDVYDLGIKPDWWKLPQLNTTEWDNVSAVIDNNAPHCRGVLILGLDRPIEQLADGFKQSAGQKWCKGFAVGRTISSHPIRQWFAGDIDEAQFIQAIADNYSAIINVWRNRAQ